MISRKNVVVPQSYNNYIEAADEDNVLLALEKSTKQFRKLLKRIPKKKVDYAYDTGKWTIRELLQHIIDAERVFVFRALWFARKDNTPLPGFDENIWATTARAGKRNWEDLIDEFKSLRESTEAFFATLDEEQLVAVGTANNNAMSVAGLGFVCAGHLAHHTRIIKERYLNERTSKGTEKRKRKLEIAESY